jgi:hemoglobin
VIDDFLRRFDADPSLVPFLGGINAVEGARIRQHFVDFICARTGGPCLYNGRDMKSTHEGLPITGAHFASLMRHIGAALEQQGVPAKERRELLALLEPLRDTIVQRPASSP